MQKESSRKTLVRKESSLEEVFKSLKPAQFYILCVLEENGCHKKKKGLSDEQYVEVNKSRFVSTLPSHVANVRRALGPQIILCACFDGRRKKYWLNNEIGEYQAFLAERTRRFAEAGTTNLTGWLSFHSLSAGYLKSQESEEDDSFVEPLDNFKVPTEYLQAITKGLSFAAVTISWEPVNTTSGGSKGSISKEISADLLTEILQKLM